MNATLKLPRPRVGLTPYRGRYARARRRPAAWLLLSALLHIAALVALLVWKQRSPEMPADQVGAPSVEMMFESPNPTGPTAPAAPRIEAIPTPGNNPVTPTAPPEERAAPPGAPPPAPQPAPQPAPPQPVAPPEVTPPTTTAPPELAPAPTAPAVPEQVPVEQAPAPSPAPPAVRLDEPDTVMLPPPVAVPEAPPQPRPPPPAPARPRPAPNPFAGTIMLGGPVTFQQPPGRPTRSGGAPNRAIDLSLGPVSAEPVVSGRYAEARKAATAGDWYSLFAAWFEQHKYYPASAAQKGEDGSSTVEITIDRYGRVSAASLIVTSGSESLDAALLGTLRGATVPPPLPGMPAPFTARVTLHYVLIR